MASTVTAYTKYLIKSELGLVRAYLIKPNNNIISNHINEANSLLFKFFFQVNEVVPEEKCKYRPERVCHPVLNGSAARTVRSMSDDPENGSRKKICEMVPTENCENKRTNPKRVLKPMKKKICRFPRPNSSYDRRIMKMMNMDFTKNP